MPGNLLKPRRFSIALPHGMTLGAAAIVCIGMSAGLCFGPPINWPWLNVKGLESPNASIKTIEVFAERPAFGNNVEAAEPPVDGEGKPQAAAAKIESNASGKPIVESRLFALANQETPAALDVIGRTRCMLARRGIIASSILRPVVEVLVNPGDRVKKGQALVKLYDLEPQSKVRVREQELKSIEVKSQYSRRNLDFAENTQNNGALPFTTFNEIRATALSNEALVHAAEAELSLAQSELNLYTLTASIDGEIAWLDVSPGTVSWPGSLIWGEIMDLSEIDARCELNPAQADQVVLGQSADVQAEGKTGEILAGNVVFIGKLADRSNGLVPVTIRVANPDERLRAEVAVRIHFHAKK